MYERIVKWQQFEKSSRHTSPQMLPQAHDTTDSMGGVRGMSTLSLDGKGATSAQAVESPGSVEGLNRDLPTLDARNLNLPNLKFRMKHRFGGSGRLIPGKRAHLDRPPSREGYGSSSPSGSSPRNSPRVSSPTMCNDSTSDTDSINSQSPHVAVVSVVSAKRLLPSRMDGEARNDRNGHHDEAVANMNTATSIIDRSGEHEQEVHARKLEATCNVSSLGRSI